VRTLALLLALSLPAAALAEDPDLREARARYEALQYDEAITRATRALKRPGHDRGELVALYELLGLCWVVLDDPRAAAEAFDALLALEPDHRLPRGTSPKLEQALEAARRERAERPSLALVGAPTPHDDGLALAARLVDPAQKTREVLARLRPEGARDFTSTPMRCATDGLCAVVAPVDPGPLALLLEARDADGRVLATVASEHAPMTLLYTAPPRPLWQEPWLWATAGTVVVGAVVGVVLLTSDEPAPPPSAPWGTLRF